MIQMNLKDLILENNFLLILVDEGQYPKKMYDAMRALEKTKDKICYVCISKKYADVLCEFKENGIDAKKFVFIDTLSSHYGLPAPVNNCVYLCEPSDLELIKRAIDDITEKEKCGAILIDTISNLLAYRENFTILKFTHSLAMEDSKKRIKKLFIALSSGVVLEKENAELIKDLMLFADKVVGLPLIKL